jgi:hypothetical protein
VCEPLIDVFGLGNREDASSYCVKAGTAVEDPSALASGTRCDAALGNCDDR